VTAAGERPVLVVGAGPTGLAAALELARQGRPVRIIDRNPGRSEHSRAIGVNARTLELLEPSGLTERLLATGLRVRRLNSAMPSGCSRASSLPGSTIATISC
jgi:3-(3-hydroxy-phenyl)propionate hydroxylase